MSFFWTNVISWKRIWSLSMLDICSSFGLSLKTWSHLDKSWGERVRGWWPFGPALPNPRPGRHSFSTHILSTKITLLRPAKEKTELSSARANIVQLSGQEQRYSQWRIVSIFGYLGRKEKVEVGFFKHHRFREHVPCISSAYLPRRRSASGSSRSYTWQSVGMAFFPGKTSPAVSSASWFWSWNLNFWSGGEFQNDHYHSEASHGD